MGIFEFINVINEPRLAPITGTNDSLSKSILGLGKLRSGWHYGKGKSFSFALLVNSLVVAHGMTSIEGEATEAFPAVEGGIQIVRYSGSLSLVALCLPDTNVQWHVENYEDFSTDPAVLSLSQFVMFLETFRWPTKNSSGSYTPNITAITKSASAVWPLKSPAMVVVHQSFAQNALWQYRDQNAYISRSSTAQESLEARLYSSEFNRTHYPSRTPSLPTHLMATRATLT